jgi:hypothetical protein
VIITRDYPIHNNLKHPDDPSVGAMLLDNNVAEHNNDEDDLALAIQLSLRQMNDGADVPVDNDVDHHDDRDNGGVDVTDNGVVHVHDDETDNGVVPVHDDGERDIDQVC